MASHDDSGRIPQRHYRYQFRNGVFTKIDMSGNPIGSTATTTQPSSFPLWEDPHRLASSTSGATAIPAPITNNHSSEHVDSFNDANAIASSTAEDAPSISDNNSIADTTVSGPLIDLSDTVADAQSPTKLLSPDELFKRDQEAIHYSKSLLLEGDTLVYITYPGNARPVDSTGFEFSDQPHRVHSQSLRATGSAIFSDLLAPTKQFRVLRRKKLVNRLPNGVKYVIDLTPPEEGDEAVNLTAELSCSLGIRMWYTAEHRIKVSSDFVGGLDPTTAQQQKRLSNASAVSEDSDTNEEDVDKHLPIVNNSVPAEAQLQEAIRRSKTDFRNPRATAPAEQEVLEYCPIRHRIGISNLLQLIEGKDVRLDSAPKMWTLFVLAKNFECESSVRDLIVTWIIAFPNSQFIEILPEKSLEMGFGLKLSSITRVAFSILVSEEALSLVSSSMGKSLPPDTSPFGRRREDLNEDLQRPIEYASKAFAERVISIFNDLVDARLPWLYELKEFQKLWRFEQQILKCTDYDKQAESLSSVYELVNLLRHFIRGRILSALLNELTKEEEKNAFEHRVAARYVPPKAESDFSGYEYSEMSKEERIFTVFFWRGLRNIGFDASCPSNLILDSKTDAGRKLANEHKVVRVTIYDLFNSVKKVGDSIIGAILTGNYADGVMPRDAYPTSPTYSDEPSDWETKAWKTTRWSQKDKQEYWTDASTITKSDIKSGVELPIRPKDTSSIFSGVLPGKFVPESYTGSGNESPLDPTSSNKSLYEAEMSTVKSSPPRRPSSMDYGEPGPALKHRNGTSRFVPATPLDRNIRPDSPFFSLSEFLSEVNWHVRELCNKMLDTNDSVIDISITDTILSLGQEEFKFLPLWAGGDDDDSGGVFDPSIPSAAAGPSGPGPSFHTGLSNASSRTASEFGDGFSSVNTSVGVEDGYSDHIDRRRVIADDDMHSETFSDDSEAYDRKGKAVDFSNYRNGPPSVAATATSATIDGDESDYYDASSVAASSETMDVDFNSFDISDTATETGLETDHTGDTDSVMGTVDENEETWEQDDDEEAFDFGDDETDDDDDMVVV